MTNTKNFLLLPKFSFATLFIIALFFKPFFNKTIQLEPSKLVTPLYKRNTLKISNFTRFVDCNKIGHPITIKILFILLNDKKFSQNRSNLFDLLKQYYSDALGINIVLKIEKISFVIKSKNNKNKNFDTIKKAIFERLKLTKNLNFKFSDFLMSFIVSFDNNKNGFKSLNTNEFVEEDFCGENSLFFVDFKDFFEYHIVYDISRILGMDLKNYNEAKESLDSAGLNNVYLTPKSNLNICKKIHRIIKNNKNNIPQCMDYFVIDESLTVNLINPTSLVLFMLFFGLYISIKECFCNKS